METEMNNLPFELLDSILVKSYLERVLKEKQVLKNKDYSVISHLASVDRCWFERIRRRKFKKQVWRCVAAYYENVDKGSAILRNNRNFLVNTIQPDDEFLDKLQSNNFLTKKKRHSLRQLQSDREKNSELLFSLNFHDRNVYSRFILCLQETNQHFATEVLDIGGAVAEVKVICEKIYSQKTLEQLVQKLNRNRPDLFRQNSSSYYSMKETAGLEILYSQKDRKGVTIFLWCKTKEALDWLKSATESDFLQEILTQLFSHLSYSVTIKDIIVDNKIFTKEVVFFSIVAIFTKRLDLRRTEEDEDKGNIVGVTKLKNEMYVLLLRSSSPRCVILVFEDQIPFSLQQRIEIEDIYDPIDIASIKMENSLYVLDRRRCVWKIKEEADEKEKKKKIIRWLELGDYSFGPKTLSVTRDGQLMLVSRRMDGPSCSLRIFGGGSEKADLRLFIPLPEEIVYLFHAVETSKGNFIIVHLVTKKTKRGEKSGSNGERKQIEKIEVEVINEVSGDGKMILRRFFPKNKEQNFRIRLSSYVDFPTYLSGHIAVVDSFDRVFLADFENNRVLVFDSHLQWNGILIPTEANKKGRSRIREPNYLFYDEEKKELIVGEAEEVFVYSLNKMKIK